MSKKPYDTDVSDEQWDALERLLPKPKSGTRKGGRPARGLREVCDAIFHHLRAGAAWRLLPRDFPPWQTVYGHFRAWRLDGTWERVHAELRRECRLGAGAPPTPETLRVDSRTVKTTHRSGLRGYDASKTTLGRKRIAAVDSLGPVWALLVTTADAQDRDAGRWLLQAVASRLPRVREVCADAGFSHRFAEWVRRACGWRVVTTYNAPEGFRVHPKPPQAVGGRADVRLARDVPPARQGPLVHDRIQRGHHLRGNDPPDAAIAAPRRLGRTD